MGRAMWQVHSSQQLSALIFDPGGSACPASGQLTAGVAIDVSCPGADDHYNANGDWTVTAVANGDGTVTVTYNNGQTHWSTTDNCGD